MVTFKIAYLKSVREFSTGKRVSCNDYKQRGYWRGLDEIRQTATKKYLVIFGSTYSGGSQFCCDHVFEILDAPDGLNIEGLENFLGEWCCEKGLVQTITYSTFEEIEHAL